MDFGKIFNESEKLSLKEAEEAANNELAGSLGNTPEAQKLEQAEAIAFKNVELIAKGFMKDPQVKRYIDLYDKNKVAESADNNESNKEHLTEAKAATFKAFSKQFTDSYRRIVKVRTAGIIAGIIAVALVAGTALKLSSLKKLSDMNKNAGKDADIKDPGATDDGASTPNAASAPAQNATPAPTEATANATSDAPTEAPANATSDAPTEAPADTDQNAPTNDTAQQTTETANATQTETPVDNGANKQPETTPTSQAQPTTTQPAQTTTTAEKAAPAQNKNSAAPAPAKASAKPVADNGKKKLNPTVAQRGSSSLTKTSTSASQGAAGKGANASGNVASGFDNWKNNPSNAKMIASIEQQAKAAGKDPNVVLKDAFDNGGSVEALRTVQNKYGLNDISGSGKTDKGMAKSIASANLTAKKQQAGQQLLSDPDVQAYLNFIKQGYRGDINNVAEVAEKTKWRSGLYDQENKYLPGVTNEIKNGYKKVKGINSLK